AYRVFPANPGIVAPLVTAREVKAMIRDGGELALLDVREGGVFAQSHLLFATSLPLSRLELGLAALVPRRMTRVVLMDDGDGLAHRAAALMTRLGYRNLAALAGGVNGWKQAGYELFSGMNVPSKAFGEFIEHEQKTPSLSAEELQAKLDAGEKLVILDSRPMDEYRVMSIPGGIDCPGAELVRSVHDVAETPETLVVVNCAGRTRSIIGAQSLINAAIPNKVLALRNGTMGWHLAGLTVERNAGRRPPGPTAQGLAKAKAAAERVAARAGVRVIDRATLARFEAERDRRSLYLFDVRSPDEYAAGHLPGARSAPGGQLVQATDTYVGTLNARLVLVDDDGIRALMTASWLLQLGWDEVYVLANALAGATLGAGPEPRQVLAVDGTEPATVAAPELKQLLDRGGALVLDFATSLQFRDAHIPGAWFAIRSQLAEALAKLPRHERLVTTSPDGVLARLAAQDLAALTSVPVQVLAGGTAAWRQAGLPMLPGADQMASPAEDVWYRPYDRARDQEAAMKEYLSWEVDLVRQIERDGDTRFRILV
ncbi:MAG TPA: rhodanese-like domain-containing protein, partial [Stellaceae bacterium]|nr:rhodanese-like domain-containing protein [Stellaceae bacterium]